MFPKSLYVPRKVPLRINLKIKLPFSLRGSYIHIFFLLVELDLEDYNGSVGQIQGAIKAFSWSVKGNIFGVRGFVRGQSSGTSLAGQNCAEVQCLLFVSTHHPSIHYDHPPSMKYSIIPQDFLLRYISVPICSSRW